MFEQAGLQTRDLEVDLGLDGGGAGASDGREAQERPNTPHAATREGEAEVERGDPAVERLLATAVGVDFYA